MNRYIDIDKIEYEDMLRPRGNGNYEECQIAYRDQIDDIPTADVVEVVRCKDCKHYETDGGALMVCKVSALNTNDDDFCSYGEAADK